MSTNSERSNGNFGPIVCSTDNRSLVDNVFSTKVQHDKSLRVEIAYLRTMVESGVISRLQWVPTNEQLADCLTKISNHAADDLIRYSHEKLAYIQASGPTRSIYGRSKRTPTPPL